MAGLRVALANLPFPPSPQASVSAACEAIAHAGRAGAGIICFPEAFVPGYRLLSRSVAPPDAAFLERAWTEVEQAAGQAGVAVILGTERVLPQGLVISVLVVDGAGRRLGFQDKVQLDPSEDGTYACGETRRVFRVGDVVFGVVICHEGWRYPETVRWAARHRAQIVFHPHLHEEEPGGRQGTEFANPGNTFHEKAMLCRAAENTIYFASVNCAKEGAATTSAIARPDGTLLAYQPYGEAGLLVADLDLSLATGLLAARYREPHGTC